MSWWHNKKHRKEVKEIIIIEEIEVVIIDEHQYHKKHRKLAAEYNFCNYKILSSMATITIPADKTNVSGQLVPLDSGGTPQPITSIQPGTEVYTSSDTGVITVAGTTPEGAFVVTRAGNNGGSATLSYTAKNLHGDDISGSDSFVVEAVVPLATSLTATYSEPQ